MGSEPLGRVRIKGPASRSHDEQEDGSQEHGEIDSCFVGHVPETVLNQEGKLGGADGDEHVNDQRESGEPGEQTQKDEHAATDLDDPHEGGHDVRPENTNLLKTPHPKLRREEKLL
ncbi:hypothetical protein KDAU_50430 [Dictyobacter aurantiacus]|uniref:Uncharacterized protein n=1 Tax=Dictyobacter aurantiacus TaxID=1936993 RepID=A0A401ZLL7_9CHLR|nr:hypothetical protein KDAU_50430 [Dictyobacter aurantiacus]